MIAPPLLAVLAGLGFGTTDFTAGVASRHNSSESVALWCQIVGAIGVLPLFLLFESSFRASDLWWCIAAGVALGFGLMLLFRCLSLGNVARVSAVELTLVAVLPTVFGLATGERPKTVVLVGIGISIVAVLLTASESGISEDKGSNIGRWLKSEQGTLAVITGVLVAMFFILISRSHEGAGMWPTLVTRVASAATVFVVMLARGERNFSFPRRAPVVTFVSALTAVAGVAAFSLATQGGLTSVSAALSATIAPVVVALSGRLVWHETVRKQQLAGFTLSLMSIALITGALSDFCVLMTRPAIPSVTGKPRRSHSHKRLFHQ